MAARIDHLVTSGTFALDGGEWDVDNNVWIVGDDTEAIVIDAAHDAAAIEAAANHAEGYRYTAAESIEAPFEQLFPYDFEGAGDITLHGRFYERESPGIVGPSKLVVTAEGQLVGQVEQAPELTKFAFEPGCRLRMKILRARTEPGTGNGKGA